MLTGSFTGLTWNGVGPGEARKRLLRTSRIDGNDDGNVDHPEPRAGHEARIVAQLRPGERTHVVAFFGVLHGLLGQFDHLARQHLADYKVPQYVAVRPEPLPRNPNGKVLKVPLRKTDFGGPVSG